MEWQITLAAVGQRDLRRGLAKLEEEDAVDLFQSPGIASSLDA